MEGRFCGENIILISDIIDYSKYKIPNVILLADFEKAFDTVKWKFLKSILKRYGCGPNFIDWVTILNKNAESCVTNNGHTTSFFKLFKGIQQGCPISALLFLLVVEIVAIMLREAPEVGGISVNHPYIKLCQLADDLTLFWGSTEAVIASVHIFEVSYCYTGLRLNKGKTEVYIIYNDKAVVEEKSSGIHWLNGPFKTLGSWFSTDPEEMIRLNFNKKLNIIETILKVCHARSLTLRGKIVIIKSLVIPHLLQLSSAIPLSEKILINLDRMLTNFIWSDRKHLIYKNILIQPIEFGGFKMVTAKNILDTSKIMWIKRLSNNIDAKWKILAKI